MHFWRMSIDEVLALTYHQLDWLEEYMSVVHEQANPRQDTKLTKLS